MIVSPALRAAGFRHGFFTRRGGASQGPFESLSFSSSNGDDPARVAENLRRAAADLGVEPTRILFLSQVHGTACTEVSSADEPGALRASQGDAVLSADPLVACGVRVADCAALLLADPTSGRVAAVHAGWRGTEAGVVPRAVEALASRGAHPAHLLAALFPHIERCCFEVGDEVAQRLLAASPDRDVVALGARGRPHVDLRRVLHAQLLAAGLAPSRIDHVAGCTMCDAARFFSFRRDGARSGRHLCAIVARSPQRG
jgi:YfiH family protein